MKNKKENIKTYQTKNFSTSTQVIGFPKNILQRTQEIKSYQISNEYEFLNASLQDKILAKEIKIHT